ncbi:MAG: DUF481 domain-containing protein, partial [Saprospiraceae bacterium]
MTRIGIIRFLILFFFNLFWSLSFAQIVNVERFRIISDSTGWFGEINLNGTFINSSINVLIVESNAFVELNRKRNLFLFLANYNFIQSDNSNLVSDRLLHFRHNLKLGKWLTWEAFIQFQQNEIQNIKKRLLIGTGPRFKIVETKNLKIYLASLLMYEDEKENVYPNIKHHDLRSSSYLSFNIRFSEKSELSSTTYIQPLVNNINDFRILNQSKLKVGINKHFSIVLRYDHQYDSTPATGIYKTNSTFTTGINYR